MFYCQLCNSVDAIFQIALEKYPLTNIYTDSYDAGQKYLFDATLYQCTCGHVQLRSERNMSAIYAADYPYNGEATTVKARRERGIGLINKHIGIIEPNCIVDIGCGQLSMITKLGECYQNSRLIAMDPVPLQTELKNVRIEFINEYFNGQLVNINVSNRPNLVILDNVLEHINDLKVFIDGVLRATCKGDYIYVCVPSFDLIYRKLQFQEIIHEHIHYFTLNELNKFFSDNGFSVVESFSNQDEGRAYNYHIFIRSDEQKILSNKNNFSLEFNLDSSFKLYSETLDICKRSIDSTNGPIWGVCASELTPTLGYFMKSNFHFCNGILDTSSHKIGKYMVNIEPRILAMGEISHIERDAHFFITAPNLTYPVLKNLKALNAENFIIPMFIF